ncbi:FxSxx-COOH system tetratricopeptide repeat protein [Streptomyces diastatochromogenes]|uniref:FxSxx-COOH system tetratricopeptide repeat protein n=1 Tax=Streptomyces diastatochromogenes TaxID=42236 RepID=UPI00368BF9EB
MPVPVPVPGAEDTEPSAQGAGAPDTESAGTDGLPPADMGGVRRVAWLSPAPADRRFEARAVGRALRAFRTAVPSAHAKELDEDATAHRLALAPFLPPVLRPSPERRWQVILLVDTAPQMAVWRTTVARLTEAARRLGGFRDVTELVLDASSAEQAVVSPPGSSLRARRISPRSLIDPSGRSAVLVLTDGAAPAWRSGAAQRLLALWGRRQPVAVLHMLPQRLWHRTGLHPYRVRLRTAGREAAGRRHDWEPAEAVSALVWSRSRPGHTVPVPVLEPRPDWLEPWSWFVAGNGPRELALGAVLTSGAPPEPLPEPATVSAFDQVAAFRGWASPEAFQLATRMAAVRLELPTMTEIQRRTLPGTRPEHMAEFLLSGLVTPLPWYDDGRCGYRFGPSVREELLAYGTRSATEQVIEQTAELLAPHSAAARDLLSYLRGEQSLVVQADDADQDFRAIERSVLRALSGAHARRASELEAVENGPVTQGQWSDAAPSADSAPPAASAVGGAADAERGAETEPGAAGLRPSGPGPDDRRSADGSSFAMPVVANGPPRNVLFTGREDLLSELEAGLRSDTVVLLPQALHGMGGVGKTQLALEYMYRHASEYDLMWWVPAEEPSQVRAAYVELARRMGLTDSAEAATAVPLVLEALRTGRPYRRWLLVFDNAVDPEDIKEFLPHRIAGGSSGSVIVTSRNPQWSRLARGLNVDVFTRQESIQLLQRRSSGITEQEAGMIAEVLGDLPLAVEQASAWIDVTGMAPGEYVALLERRTTELLETNSPASYPQTVAAAWNISLDRLETTNPGALHLLQLCSFLAPEPIPRAFFGQQPIEPVTEELDQVFRDPLRLGRAIRDISRYALVRIDHHGNTIQMHRLVRAVLQDRLAVEQQERFRRAAQLVLANNSAADPQDPRSWPLFESLHAHVLACQAQESSQARVRRLVYDVARYLLSQGTPVDALDFTDQALRIWRDQSGEADPQVLLLEQHLCQVLRHLGRHEDAARLTEHMLAVLEEAGSQREEEYLGVKSLAAGDLRARGDVRSALELDRDVHTRSGREFGSEDLVTLEYGFRLAVSLRANGDFARALELDEEVRRRRTEILGVDHPATLSALASVALDRMELGMYPEALSLCQEYMEHIRVAFGEDHPETARALTRLAVVQRKAGEIAAAARNTADALTALTGHFGAESPDVLHTALHHSIGLRHTGELREAFVVGTRTRGLLQAALGSEHPHTLCADVNLAVTLRWLNQLARAGAITESALARCSRTLGADHPFTVLTTMNLATVLFSVADFDRARSLDSEVLTRLREQRGETHPLTLAAQTNLATDLSALGITDEAAALQHQAAEEIRNRLGDGHPAYLQARAWRRADADLDPLHL